jgi:hypothetical protein
VDTNKGTEAEPNLPSRIVAKELKGHESWRPGRSALSGYAAFERVKMIISHRRMHEFVTTSASVLQCAEL